MMNEYLDALEPAKLRRVLEVGCGTGVATRGLIIVQQARGYIHVFGFGLVRHARAADPAEVANVLL